MNKKNMLLYAVLLCLFLAAFGSSLSAVMLPLSTETLTGDSDLIIIGEITGIRSHLDPESEIIYSRATVFVYRVIRGEFGGSTIDVEYEGGGVGEMSMGASDQPRMAIGEKVLLFLESKGSFDRNYGSVYGVVGAVQGKYSIRENGLAEKGGFTVVEFDSEEAPGPGMPHKIQSRRVEDIIDNHIPLDRFVDKIKGKKLGGCPRMPGEHKVHPYVRPETLCRGESCIRPNSTFGFFFAFSDSLLVAHKIVAPDEGITSTTSETPGISSPMYSYIAVWGVWSVGLKINTSGGPSYSLGAVTAGMNEWNNVYTSAFKWRHAGSTTSRVAAKNGVNVLYFTNLNYYLGYSRWWSTGGYIVETDVELDSSPVSYYPWTFIRLRAVVMHELGHSLGFNHVSNNSIMKIPASDSLIRLFADDINAVTALYPSFNACSNFNGQDGDTKERADILLQNKNTGDLAVWLLNGTTLSSAGKVASTGLTWQIKGTGDFNGDGKADILLWHPVDARMAVWLMNGISISSSGVLEVGSLTWQIMGTGDFNGDGNNDILLRHSTQGSVAVWMMNGTSLSSSGVPAAASPDWQIESLDDFNADGKTDVLFRNGKSGSVAVWLLNGTTLDVSGVVAAVTSDWQVLGTGDFDADGKADILWKNGKSGDVAVWLLNGTTLAGTGKPGNVTDSWKFRGIGDFNGDGKSDILWRNIGSGKVAVWLIDGVSLSSSVVTATASLNWKIRGLGDFNDDDKTDILLRNNTNGDVAVWLMNGTSLLSTGKPGNAALSWKIN